MKPTNNVFARYLLVSRNQGSTESVSDFLQALKVLAKNCTFTAVSANDYREQLIRDSFIKGLNSSFIKQRLLEHGDLTLTRAIELAETLDSAQRQSSSMGTTASSQTHSASTARTISETRKEPLFSKDSCEPPNYSTLTSLTKSEKCFFCGGSKHSRNLCPARNCTCYGCGKRGHFVKVCRKQASSVRGRSSAAVLTTEKPVFVEDCLSSILASAPSCLGPSIVKATLLGKEIEALVDSGASENFIDSKIASQLNLRVEGPSSQIEMASEGFAAKTLGKVNATLTTFDNVRTRLSVAVRYNGQTLL